MRIQLLTTAIALVGLYLQIVSAVSTKKKNIVYKSNSNDIYELRMQRSEQINDINIGQVVTRLEGKCDASYLIQFHNSTWSTSMCFERDLAYQVFVALGKPKQKNQEFINLEVNINSPWTWIKSNNCRECEEMDELTYQGFTAAKCQEECNIQQKQIISKYNPYKLKDNLDIQEKGGKKAVISNNDSGVYGTFLNYQLSFLAYNPNKNVTIKDTVKEKLSLNSYNAFEDLVTLKNMKIVHAEKLFNIQKYQGDGSMGLARLDIEYDSKNIEPNTHILKELIESEKEEEKGDLVFGIYINRQSKEVQDFAITLGGYNAEYSKEVDVSEYFIDLKINKKKSNYQYVVPLNEINILGNPLLFTEAYITLNSSFLVLPFDILVNMVKYMNDNYGMSCQIVDKKYLMVYCTDVVPRNFNDKSVEFKFNGLTLSVPFKDFLHLCKHDKVALFNQDISQAVSNYCILSLASSRDNKVILGEVFLNKRYTVFDIENNRIGFLPPQTVNFFSDEDEKRAFVDLLMKLVTFIFILGILSIYFMKSIMKYSNKFFSFIGRLLDAQQVNKPRHQEQAFQSVNQNEGIEIQNNTLDFSMDTKDRRPVVVPANVIPSNIPSFKLHPQKRKIFEGPPQKQTNNSQSSQQQNQNAVELVITPPPLQQVDLL